MRKKRERRKRLVPSADPAVCRDRRREGFGLVAPAEWAGLVLDCPVPLAALVGQVVCQVLPAPDCPEHLAALVGQAARRALPAPACPGLRVALAGQAACRALLAPVGLVAPALLAEQLVCRAQPVLVPLVGRLPRRHGPAGCPVRLPEEVRVRPVGSVGQAGPVGHRAPRPAPARQEVRLPHRLVPVVCQVVFQARRRDPVVCPADRPRPRARLALLLCRAGLGLRPQCRLHPPSLADRVLGRRGLVSARPKGDGAKLKPSLKRRILSRFSRWIPSSTSSA